MYVEKKNDYMYENARSFYPLIGMYLTYEDRFIHHKWKTQILSLSKGLLKQAKNSPHWNCSLPVQYNYTHIQIDSS